MFSESCNDRHHRIGDCTAADRLMDHDNASEISDNPTEIGDDAAGPLWKTGISIRLRGIAISEENI